MLRLRCMEIPPEWDREQDRPRAQTGFCPGGPAGKDLHLMIRPQTADETGETPMIAGGWAGDRAPIRELRAPAAHRLAREGMMARVPDAYTQMRKRRRPRPPPGCNSIRIVWTK